MEYHVDIKNYKEDYLIPCINWKKRLQISIYSSTQYFV